MKELEKDLNGQYSPENYYKCSCWYKCQKSGKYTVSVAKLQNQVPKLP